MNASAFRWAALLGSLSLAACAHTQPESTYVAPEEVGPAPVNALVQRQDVDYAYVAAVERLARSRGVEVKWVNMPLRRIDTQ